MLTGEEKLAFMLDFAGALGSSKAASALLVPFIPSTEHGKKH
jgi:hypothetical protein